MTEGSLQLLCTGDLHLGRHPTRIPDRFDSPQFSPRSVWHDIVRVAIDRAVDAVILTGDIADRENRYFEAYGGFESGIIKLSEAGIPIVVVAGNHDSEFLPRMVNDIGLDNLHLLGSDGTWERWTLENEGSAVAHFDGWSFPSQHVSRSPLEKYSPSKSDDAPQIGVVHADLDSPRSQYAPVASSELENTDAACWLLGHIHAPSIRIDSDPLTLYPGSPQALDPGERGAHGPWLLTIEPDGSITTEQRTIATVRYDELRVDVSDAEDLWAVTPLVSSAIQQHVEDELDTRNLAAFFPRIILTGRTSAHTQLVDERHTLEENLSSKHGSVEIHIESITVDTRPDIDLETQAASEGPVSYLAELLLAIENDKLNDESNQLIDNAHGTMREVYATNTYNLLRREAGVSSPERDEALETVEQEARILLDSLLQQKEESR